ncbi:MAG TPA: NUDIX hydrolase [Candidatus Saccharimonadales bacterium]
MLLHDNGKTYTQASGVILFDSDGHILVQFRSGKKHGFIPGGQKEGMESPRQAALREIREEMGLTLTHLDLVLIDHRTAKRKTFEVIHYLFYGGILSKEQIKNIAVDGGEVNSISFMTPENALHTLDPPSKRRVRLALNLIAKHSFSNYYENQITV